MTGDSRRPSLRDYRPVQLEGLIRVGRDFDGGYVLPREVIESSHALLSLGVNDDWSFEEGVLTHNPAMRITCVDGTTGMKRIIVKAAQKSVEMIGHLLTLQISKFKRDFCYLTKPLEFRRFFSRHELLQLMVAEQPSPGSITLPTLLDRVVDKRGDRWVMVKADIEGAEFDVLPGLIGRTRQVSALIVEFHRLDLCWDRFVVCMAGLTTEFHIAHVHGNNFDGFIPGTSVPITLEVTLVNKAFARGTPPPAPCDYPLPNLDMPNNRKRPDMRIAFD